MIFRAKKLIGVISILVISTVSVFSEIERPSFGLTFLPQFNYFSSDFYGFPPNTCCSDFTNGTGFGFRTMFDFSYSIFNREIPLASKLYFAPSVGIESISLHSEKGEYFADVIIDDAVQKAISQHNLDFSLKTINLLLAVKVAPTDLIHNFSVGIGLSFDFPISSKFSQGETLLTPKNYTFENGLRTRNQSAGEIPNLILPQISFNAFVQKGFAKIFDINLSAIVGGGIPLTQLTQSEKLRVYRLYAGINASYQIPKPKPAPPSPAPLPQLPEPTPPPSSKEYALDLIVKTQQKTLKNSDTIEIIEKVKRKFTRNYVIPILFFEKNDFGFYPDNHSAPFELSPLHNKNIEVIEAIASFFAEHGNVNAKIVANQIDDELSYVAQSRAQQIYEFLVSKGIEARRLAIEYPTVSTNEIKSPELLPEMRTVQIIFSDGTIVLSQNQLIESLNETDTVNLQLELVSSHPNEEKSSKIEVYLNENLISETPSKQHFLRLSNFSNEIQSTATLKILCSVEFDDDFNTGKQVENEYVLISKKIYFDSIEELTFSGNRKAILLGLFKFDSDEFYWVNPSANDIIAELESLGKKMIILGSADDIGGEKYNENLARRRAVSALKMLNRNLELDTRRMFNGSDLSSPYNRILNRSVWLIFE